MQSIKRMLLCPTPSLQVAQIAHFLDVPAIKLRQRTQIIRQALDTACKIRDHIKSFADLRKEMADDIEVNALLLVLEHHQEDACNWVSV